MPYSCETEQKVDRALLCLNDIDTELATKTRIFGQPLVYHLLKNLHLAGISEIALSVETIVPELVSLVDRLTSEGLNLVVLRKGAEALQFAAKPGLFLLQNAAIWAANGLLGQLVAGESKLLLTLPEDPRFGSFERIDLNRRWAGIAVLEGKLAAQSQPIEEGWSIDSSLLRSALQADYPAKLLADDAFVQLAHGRSDNQQLQKLIGAAFDAEGAANRPIARFADLVIGKFAAARWWQVTIDFTPPATSVCAVMAAFLGYPTTALSLGTMALLAREIRARWRQVSYLKPFGDAIDFSILGILILTLYLGLGQVAAPFDAVFLTSILAAVLALGQMLRPVIPKPLISPLMTAAALTLLSVGGHLLIGAKVVIIALIAALLAGHLRRQG